MQTAQRININLPKREAEDVKSLLAYSHYLIMKAQLIGNLCFDGHTPSEEENRVAEQCRQLSSKISRRLNICKISEIPELLDYYDITYRIGNKSIPDNSVISNHKNACSRLGKQEIEKLRKVPFSE